MALADSPILCIGYQNMIEDRNRSMLLDADGEKVAFIVRAPKSGDISNAHVYTGTVTTSDTMKISLQDVDTSNGEPDETVDQSGTVLMDTTNARFSVALDSNRTVTKGEYIAVVIEFNSFVAGNLNIKYGDSSYGRTRTYPLLKTAGSWATQGSRRPFLLLEYSDGSFPHIADCLPGPTSQWTSLDSSDTPDEVALRFKTAGPMRLCYAEWKGDIATAALPELVLYEGTTALGTISNIDGDVGGSVNQGTLNGVFPSAVELTAGTVYRLGLRPTTTATVGLHRITVDSNAHLEATPGGVEFYSSTRTDQGSWTDDTTIQPSINLYFDQLDDGAGGGSVVITRPRRII